MSPSCDFKFFIDAPSSMVKRTPSLQLESTSYGDIIFRDSCPLMQRHPDYINYGNSPPVGDNLFRVNRTEGNSNDIVADTGKIPNPDYPLRRLYKIDWKVCFVKWAKENNAMAEYFVFVEDDSFVCTENLLHQTNLLFIRSNTISQSFRAGTSMYDGFDDSSTIMTKLGFKYLSLNL